MTALEPGAAPALLASGYVFTEGPRWRGDRLWFSDMHGEAVHTVTQDGETRVELTLPGGKPSGLGFLPDGSVLVVSMTDRTLLRLAGDGTHTVHADLGELVTDELNDMVVALDGTAYVGTYPSPQGTGVLIRVAPDGTAAIAARDLEFPNGTVLSPDGGTLIVAESLGRRLTAFDVDAHGGLDGRRVLAETPGAGPDGIALDAHGAVWVAFPIGHAFHRILPGGEITDRIDVGDRMPAACALGGPDRRTLFLLSAEHWSAAELAGRRTSTIETIRVTVPGAGTP